MNSLKQRLAAGEAVFGFWSMIPSVMVANILGASGADFVIADLEHGNADLETLEALNYAVRASGSTPVARLPHSTAAEILHVLEVGIDSILMSHIASKNEAQKLVDACRYPPLGTRGLSPFTTVHGYDGRDVYRTMGRANDEVLVGGLVEGVSGLSNVNAIADVEGLDIVYLGLYDLASSLGHADDLDHPEVRAVLVESVEAITAAGKVAGTVARDTATMKDLHNLGFKFIAYRNDSALLMQGCRNAVGDFASMIRGLS